MGRSAGRLAKPRVGETTKTNQDHTGRTFPALGRRRTLRCWRRSAGGCRRTAHGVRFVWGSMAPAVPSRCPFGGLGKGQAAQVVGSLGCPAAGCKECPFVGLQKLNPIADVTRVSYVAVKPKLCAQEGGPERRN